MPLNCVGVRASHPQPPPTTTTTAGKEFVMGGLSGYSRSAFAYSRALHARNMVNYEGRGFVGCDRPVTKAEEGLLGSGA